MAGLTIRNVPEEVRTRLRLRAAKADRSAEAEARAILAVACLSDDKARPLAELQAWVDQLYHGRKPRGVVDALIEERRREARHG
jgi:plasmid stability protein